MTLTLRIMLGGSTWQLRVSARFASASEDAGQDGSFVNLIGRLDEDVWEDQQTHEKKSAMVIILDDIEYASGGGKSKDNQNTTKRKDIRQHQLRPYPQITAALPATSRLAEAIPSSTKTERQQLNRAYKRRT